MRYDPHRPNHSMQGQFLIIAHLVVLYRVLYIIIHWVEVDLFFHSLIFLSNEEHAYMHDVGLLVVHSGLRSIAHAAIRGSISMNDHDSFRVHL